MNVQAQQLIPVDTFAVINSMISQVDTNIVVEHILHLQDYGTRKCSSPEALLAQQWIQDQYDSYGLTTEIQDFPIASGNTCSDNIIATQSGNLYPDQYVVIGGHYDSYTFGASAPGADDNASGTSGVMEVARILSQYEFERTIIYCAFSAEEIGLYGSEAYAASAQAQGMNILGYFNMDMIGYRHGNDSLHADMLAPASATPLSNFFKAVNLIYQPAFIVKDAVVVPGGSDHESFNDHGYMGIFPAEEDQYYSPYIHTVNDTVGLSVNSLELAKCHITAQLASVASLARPMGATTIKGIREQSNWKITPNPASDFIIVTSDQSSEARLLIYNMNGAKVLETKLSGKKLISLNCLSKGIFHVQLIAATSVSCKKLVVR